MKLNNPPLQKKGKKINDPVIQANNHLKKMMENDIVMNVGFKDVMIRFVILFLLSILLLVTREHFIFYLTPVIFYLFVSALMRFCVIKYIWHRYIKKEPASVPPPYGKDLNSPEESI